MSFPNDTNKHSDLNAFIKLLLNKKVNYRVCSFSKLKATNFLNEFNWEDLLDFKIKPPYIPECDDFTKYLTIAVNPLESVIKVGFHYVLIYYKNNILNFNLI